MDNSLVNPSREQSVATLLKLGYRIQFSNSDMTLLSKPASHSTLHVAQVTADGKVGTKPLSEFLEQILS